jgi:glycosyltransferase involved in cell wall biosynthesis
MKVLIVSFSFPPSNVAGAIRVGKLARYLDLQGHELRVLTTDIGPDRSLPLEIPRERVVYTNYQPREHRFARFLQSFWQRPPAAPSTGGGRYPVEAPARRKSLREWLQRQYNGLIIIPDLRRDWIKIAVRAGRQLIEEWRPEIIFASAPPFTGLIVANLLGRTCDIPWIADLRDPWVDNPYYSEPAWRKPIDAAIEKMTLRNAAVLVTVSPIWAEQLRRRHRRPTEVVYNGFAAEDFSQLTLQVPSRVVLTIRYTGSIYRGFRDPTALFAAVALLPDALRRQVMVEFYGDSSDEILILAEQHGIRDRVAASPPVPYRRALELQMNADILLLLQWSDVRDEGNLPSKIFEYFYARRPILLIGYEQGVAAGLIRERGAGLVSNNPGHIRDQLRTWIEEKQAGRLTRLDPSVSLGLSRDEQFRKLEAILIETVRRCRSRNEQNETVCQ